MNRVPTLIGIGGPFKGEVFYLDYLRPLVVGRSRQADISVKRTPHYRAQNEHDRESDADTKTISAKHFQITFFNLKSIELKNLSVNGTLLDGLPVKDAALIQDISNQPHEIQFGAHARFKLALCEREENKDEPLPLE